MKTDNVRALIIETLTDASGPLGGRALLHGVFGPYRYNARHHARLYEALDRLIADGTVTTAPASGRGYHLGDVLYQLAPKDSE